jgi:2'-5' RNA ligase
VETAVLLCVAEAEDLVGPWRDKGEPSAANAVPAHVTLLTPFLPAEAVDEGVLAELRWFFAGVDAFRVSFAGVGEFADSGVLYLDPVGAALDELAESLARRWPETPPYAGRVDAPHAHLTVVRTADAALRAQAAEALRGSLPLDAVSSQAALWSCDEHGLWSEATTFAFGEGEPV